MIVKEKIINFLEYILAFCIVINANTIWNYVYINKILWIVTLTTLYLLIILSINEINLIKYKTKILGILIIFIVSYNSIYIFLSGGNKGEFIIDFILFLLGVIIYSLRLHNIKNLYKILYKISTIVVILAIISLIFYILGSIFNYIKPTDYIKFKWGGTREIPSYHNMYYVTQKQWIFNIGFIRNTGIFTEAPMYGFVLIISLIIELFFKKIESKKELILYFMRILILIVTIFTTISTTAIGLLSIIIPVKIIINIIENRGKCKKLFLLNIILLIIFTFLGIKIGGYFLSSKIKASSDNRYGSFTVRKDDFKVGYKVWRENKLTGVGFDQYQYVQQQMNFIFRGDDIGGSSGLMKVMPEGGLVLLGMYIIPFILAMLYGIKKRDLRVISVYIFVYILFIVTAIQYRYMMIYFLALGFSYILAINENKTIKENNK